MMTVAQIVERIGRREIADAVGVTPAAVWLAIRDERFPSAWFAAVRDLAEKQGIEICDAHFAFKRAS